MFRKTVSTLSSAGRWSLRGLTLAALLALAALAAGCGAAATPPPAPTPTATLTPTPVPTGFHALVVTNALKGAGTAVQQTQVAAIDPATGHQLWSRALMGYPGPFEPARAGDAVVVSVGIQASPYPASQISAFDVRTGAGLWDHNYGPNTQAFVGSTGSSVIVVTSAVSTQAPGAPQGLTVAALSPADGSQLWRTTLANQEMYGAIRAADGAAYVLGGQTAGADTSYTLTALNATTGAQLWQKALGTGTVLGTVAGDGAYYVGLYPAHLTAAVPSRRIGVLALLPVSAMSPVHALSPFDASTLTAYRASNGAQMWQMNGFAAPQAENGGTLYTTIGTLDSSGRLSYSLMALKATSGARVWQSGQLGFGDQTSKPYAAADATGVYAFAMPETTPCVHAVNASSGASLWTALANTTAQAGAAGLGRVYTATVPATPSGQQPQPANVTITALSATTGGVQWTLVVEQSESAWATVVLA